MVSVRVSTGRQGKSGLGLAAQQAAIARFAEIEGFEMIQTFTEVETGKGADVGAFAGFEESCRPRAQPENVCMAARFPAGTSAVIPAASEYARKNAGRLEIRAW